MRTFVLSMSNRITKKQTTFRCEANSYNEAVEKAQKALGGSRRSSRNNGGFGYASFNY